MQNEKQPTNRSRFDVVVQSVNRCVVLITDARSKLSFEVTRAEASDLSRVFDSAVHEMETAVIDPKGGIVPPAKA